VSVPVPVWDRNQGNIRQAQGSLLKATEEAHRVRDDLSSKLAEAFERYDNNRVLLGLYRAQILPSQVQSFRAAVKRHAIVGEDKGGLGFLDLITAEQNLATTITAYLGVLRDQWTAVVDVAGLLQTKDLFQTGAELPVAPVPDLEHLQPLPCCHPVCP